MQIWRITRGRMLRMVPELLQPMLAKKQVLVALVTVVLTIALIPFETRILPLARPFRLDNPYIAYPYVAQEHVPVWLLFLLAFLLPFGIIVGSGVILSRYRDRAAISALAFVGATVATALVSDILKYLIGNQRPDFLARCKPHTDAPLHEALDVASWCTSDNWFRTWEGCRSTPSGHSSISFNGMGFLAFWILDTFGLLAIGSPLYVKAIGFTPFLVSTFIALTRIVDHKHHWIDIIFGAVIGTTTSYYAYKYIVKHTLIKHEELELRSQTLTA